MSSSHDIRSSPAFHLGSFLLLQDETPSSPLVSKGHGALASLIRERSTTSLHRLGKAGSIREVVPCADDEEALLGHSNAGQHPDWSLFRTPRDDMSDEPQRRAEERRMSAVLNAPHMRSMRLIGNSNPRYRWERYWKTEAELRSMKQKIRNYYRRTNYLVQQYLYIDRLLDSSLPHDLLNEYNDMPASSFRGVEIPITISEESLLNSKTPGSLPATGGEYGSGTAGSIMSPNSASDPCIKRVKRTPKDIFRPTETTPLFSPDGELHDAVATTEREAEDGNMARPEIPFLEDEEVDSSERIVTVAIYVNLIANAILLAGKIAVIVSVPSVSVLASLVDAVLDFLSTGIVWTTTWLIAQSDQYRYPVGRRR